MSRAQVPLILLVMPRAVVLETVMACVAGSEIPETSILRGHPPGPVNASLCALLSASKTLYAAHVAVSGFAVFLSVFSGSEENMVVVIVARSKPPAQCLE